MIRSDYQINDRLNLAEHNERGEAIRGALSGRAAGLGGITTAGTGARPPRLRRGPAFPARLTSEPSTGEYEADEVRPKTTPVGEWEAYTGGRKFRNTRTNNAITATLTEIHGASGLPTGSGSPIVWVFPVPDADGKTRYVFLTPNATRFLIEITGSTATGQTDSFSQNIQWTYTCSILDPADKQSTGYGATWGTLDTGVDALNGMEEPNSGSPTTFGNGVDDADLDGDGDGSADFALQPIQTGTIHEAVLITTTGGSVEALFSSPNGVTGGCSS